MLYAPMHKKIQSLLTKEENLLVLDITKLMDDGNFELAIALIDTIFVDGVVSKASYFGFLLACRSVDIGTEFGHDHSLSRGLAYMQDHLGELRKVIDGISLNYCLGNAKKTNFQRKYSYENGFNSEELKVLLEVKNHYWKSFKLALKRDCLAEFPEVIVNLANCLSFSGRVTEALYYLDLVIKQNPQFYMAHVNRANALKRLNDISSGFTYKQMVEIREGFAFGMKHAKEKNLKRDFERQFNAIKARMKEIQETDDIVDDAMKSEEEFQKMSVRRQMQIVDGLTLNEHALYCRCAVCDRDNITIPLRSAKIIADKSIVELEHYLNRFKSEFGFIRKLFYDSQQNSTDDLGVEYEVCLTDLGTNEKISYSDELLRNSFRLCNGLLDKIAEGIHVLFKHPPIDNKPIYFADLSESIEKSLNMGQLKGNRAIQGLFSQSQDVLIGEGEWYKLRAWRNDLEHRLLVIVHNKKEIADEYGIISKSRNLTVVEHSEFLETTKYLLQFTRSAIFNFTFACRHEFIQQSKLMSLSGVPTKRIKPVVSSKS
jgi:hypothetical protein